MVNIITSEYNFRILNEIVTKLPCTGYSVRIHRSCAKICVVAKTSLPNEVG